MKQECQNCKHSYEVPFLLEPNDSECSYVRCDLTRKATSKWWNCEDWEEKKNESSVQKIT